MTFQQKDITRFWSKVNVTSDPDECWVWTAKATFPRGYGQFKVNGTPIRAHRISFTLSKGAISNGLCVLHSCDNPPCCNPKHLRLGTAKDNGEDMVSRGRSLTGSNSTAIKNPEKRPRGELHGQSKLTDLDVFAIRKLGDAQVNGQIIASKFGVTYRTIRNILSGRKWKHLLPGGRTAT